MIVVDRVTQFIRLKFKGLERRDLFLIFGMCYL